MFKRLLSAFEKRPFLCLLAVNALFIVVAVNLLPFQYEPTDDRVLAWNTSGYLTGTPRIYTVYMHVFWAWFESKLYTICPMVEWKTWLFLAIHLFSLTIIGYCVSKTNHNRWAKGMALTMVYVLEMYNLTHFQFTSTAGLAALSGMLLIVLRKRWWAGIAMFLLGVLIRYQSAMFCGLVTAAYYPLVLARRGFDIKQMAVLMLSAVLAFGLHGIDVALYGKDPKLKEMREYDILRGKMHDNSNWIKVHNRPPKGLSRKGMEGGLPLPYVPESVWESRKETEFNQEEIRLFLRTIDEYTSYMGIPGVKKLKQVPLQFAKFPILFGIGLLVIFGAFFGCENKKERIALVFASICFLLSLAYVALNVRLVPRAVMCGWLPLVFIPLCLIPFDKKVTSVFAGLSFLLTVAQFAVSFPQQRASDLYKQQKQLVNCGIGHGAKYLYSISPIWLESEYPFGIRLSGLVRITEYMEDIAVSKEMLEEGSVVMMVDKKWTYPENIDEIVLTKRTLEPQVGAIVEAEELCVTQSYILYRLYLGGEKP